MVVNTRQMWRHIKLYPRFLKQSLKAHMEYDIDFFMGVFASISGHLAAIFFLTVLYRNVPAIVGWTKWEVMLLYGLAILSRSIASTLFQGVWSISGNIARGEMDKLLVRPVWPLFHILGSAFGVQGIGHFISGSAMVIIAGLNSGLTWNAYSIGWFVLAIISGCVVLISALLLAECISFWTGGQQTNLPYLAYQIGELGRYPLEVYPLPIRSLVTWVIPFAFGTYFPTAAILHKPGAQLAFLSPVMAIFVMIVAIAVWKVGLRGYTGTGS
ncbi:ABC transporter permease [Lederbergia citrea]|uniref:ABC-2 family transporter protein n=1 Tax=Lederbergia citrea TaxID=2833581 RepID=A0A942US00_9BACI|nr:ABC-2 family transporter protein [Lederbergia citrea]MBS4176874.1 ABC-2 family transporter protein [Lederbergia citrea]MBS4203442.1 ABC-2 family transporter protein [Lederbergia citrea]MBS4221889.1 ABC-2 family transporter protein [Lederbergia citrea]